jgi:hypothetical protein
MTRQPESIVFLPAAKCFEQSGLDIRWDVDGWPGVECFDCRAHLFNVRDTGYTDGEVLVKPNPVNRRQPFFQVVRYQFRQLFAAQFFLRQDAFPGAA